MSGSAQLKSHVTTRAEMSAQLGLISARLINKPLFSRAMATLQCRTAKHDKVARDRMRFFEDKWTSDLDSEGLKMSKSPFSRFSHTFLGLDNFLTKILINLGPLFEINLGSTLHQSTSLPAVQPTNEISVCKLPNLLLFQLAPADKHP
jgi:hypothetical protein